MVWQQKKDKKNQDVSMPHYWMDAPLFSEAACAHDAISHSQQLFW